MKKLALVAVVLLMGLALAAAAMPLGPDDAEGQVFPGKRIIEGRGSADTFGGTLQEPAIITSADSITLEGAGATFSTPLQEP